MTRPILCVLLSLFSGLALADAGRILYVTGQVTVERQGKLYRAAKNSALVAGDTINTGASGRTHLRMRDKTLISLKPNTRFAIEEFQYSGESEARPREARTQARPDRSVFGLFKGGFRAITGLIGQRDKNAFGVNTPVATIGIRGTSFVADLVTEQGRPQAFTGAELASVGLDIGLAQDGVLSDADAGLHLAQLADSAGTQAVSAGATRLTVGVGDGAVVLTNSFGTVLLENGEFGQVAQGRQPRRLSKPQVDSEASSEQQGEETESASDDEGRRAAVGSRSMTGEDGHRRRPPRAQESETVPEETEYLVALGSRKDVSVVSTLSVPGQQTQVLTIADRATIPDENGNLTNFIGRVERNGQLVPAVIELVDGRVANPGQDIDTGMQWGRWAGDALRVSFADGTTRRVDLGSAQLHLIQSASHDGRIALPLTGSREFVLRGNTDPTDNLGNLGFLGVAVLQADFDNARVSSGLALSINEQVWEAVGSAPLGAALSPSTPHNVFSGQYTTVSVAGAEGAAGEFSGFLTDRAATAGLSYQLRNDTQTVSGVVAFSAQPQ